MKFSSRLLVLLFVLSVFIISGCGADEQAQSTDANENNEKLDIYTTLYPLEYFANEIGGSHVNIVSILPSGADAHTYEPTSKTMVDIAGADAFIFNGAELEPYADTINEALKDEDLLSVEASSGIALSNNMEEQSSEDVHNHAHEEESTETEHAHEEGESTETEHAHEEGESTETEHAHEEGESTETEHAHEEEASGETDGHHHGDVDPHIWLDPIRAISIAENIKNTLIELKPEAEQEFVTNFENLKSRLEKLDEEFHSKLESQVNNEILVTHAAYGYWEQVYGLEQIAIAGISSSDEPSQKQLENVIDIVKEHGINYLLFEQNVKPKVASVIQNETNVKSLNIHNLAVLTDENIENGDDYFTLMYENLDVLVTALKE
ncbi:metal ABC transporter solute-binding protein, Zn/Mn family [Aquibacillus rhizosphaerae]|uniref:Zinc ABC transporter substrate-binding protein n=1 Tax=Aquibacillus rhizosphaerae TaxID=3051431 RepID=A0ABT7LEN7_9BACI|nr:zinc ABC transporter substrate-binding protein [Aquibacillus sp. LR5S19]MDL4843006.1 zinc ABC transporter substrate-binding protein [Aquibacillus sp. LR5S19]